MFHTAANAITLTEEAIRKIKSLRFTATTDSIKSWGGQANSFRLSRGNILTIGELKWNNLSIFENINSGQNTDGKFGLDLFENKVIEIDFNIHLLFIRTTLPANTSKYEKLYLVFEADNMFIEAACEIGPETYKNKFLIHSG